MAKIDELVALPYRSLDWDLPLDVDAAVARCPEGAVIKGLMSAKLVEAAAAIGRRIPGARDHYLPFQTYPLREHMVLMREAGALLWPKDPVRIHFRRFGRAARATLLEQPYGRVALGKGGMTPVEVVERLARAYRVILDFVVTPHVIVQHTTTTIYVQLTDVWYFLDSCHVGVFEGVLLDPSVVLGTRAPTLAMHLFDEHNGVLRVEC